MASAAGVSGARGSPRSVMDNERVYQFDAHARTTSRTSSAKAEVGKMAISVPSASATSCGAGTSSGTSAWKQARRIEDKEQLGGDVDERSEQRVQETEPREHDAEPIDEQGSREVLQDDAAASAGDPQSLDELEKVVAQQHDVRRFPRDVGSRAHRDPDVRLSECRCVVDAVSDHRH